eukprot:1572691-Amphidinium_carterae.1
MKQSCCNANQVMYHPYKHSPGPRKPRGMFTAATTNYQCDRESNTPHGGQDQGYGGIGQLCARAFHHRVETVCIPTNSMLFILTTVAIVHE